MLRISHISRAFASARKVFITTPIFYVNARPHIGHLYSAILASAVKQVHLMSNDHQVFMSTGTDEHGLKVQQKAKEEKMPPDLFCQQNSEVFRKLFDKAKLNYDVFIRTSEMRHKTFVHKFWNEMMSKGRINKADYSGFYSVQEESFIPEKDLIKRLDPDDSTGAKYMHYTSLSLHANQPVEYLTEQNYQIKFSPSDVNSFLNLIERKSLVFSPASLVNEVKGYISQNVLDLCISRPSKRVSWGIEVPNDREHVIYVWFEALLSYMTFIRSIISDEEEFEVVHIIGKDISKFHCYLWPLILLLNGKFPFKIKILMHNYWLKNDTKMSKSIGNVVNPDEVIDKFGIDAVRFYFLAAGPLLHDVSFDEKALMNVFYNHIPDTYINLILRLSNSKVLNSNDFNKVSEFSDDMKVKIEENMILVKSAIKELKEYNFIQAAHQIHLILINLNNLIQISEFWKRAQNLEERRNVTEIVCFSLEFVRIISVLFAPFLPELMINVSKYIGIEERYMKFDFCYFRTGNCTGDEFDNLVNGYFRIDASFKDLIFVNKIKDETTGKKSKKK